MSAGRRVYAQAVGGVIGDKSVLFDVDVTYRDVHIRLSERDGEQVTAYMTRDQAQRLADAIVTGLQENQR